MPRKRSHILLAALVAGCHPRSAAPPAAPDPSMEVKELRQGGFRFINPLLECDPLSENRRELKIFQDKVDQLIARIVESKRASHVSVYFRDLNNGPWFGSGEAEKFIPGSLLKVPVMIAYLAQAEKDPKALSKKLVGKPADIPYNQAYPPSDPIQVGREYTVEQLLEKMIVQSDNAAGLLLLRNIDQKAMVQTYLDLDLAQEITAGRSGITVQQYASFFRILFNSTYLNRAMSEKALELLSRSEFKSGLVAGVPGNIAVAHKFGERKLGDTKQLHDCGIVYWPGHPYLLAVMTRGQDIFELAKVIQEVSRVVADEMDHQFGR